MSQKYEKLKTLLKELFQPDLGFGLYDVMHAESAENEVVKANMATSCRRPE